MTPPPWLPLLGRLTGATRTWGVWKDPRSALTGTGDIDSVAERGEWHTVLCEFRAWSQEHGFGPVLVCTHYPDLLIMVACDGERPTTLLQVDVYTRHVFRGTTLVSARQLAPLMERDPRGFRRLPPGAEALLVLIRGARRGGNAPPESLLDARLRQVREDPEGAVRLAHLVGLSRDFVHSLEEGTWSRRDLARFELRHAFGLLDPRELARCVRRDYRRIRRCALVDALEDGRRVAGDRADWLRNIRRDHDVHDVRSPATTSLHEP